MMENVLEKVRQVVKTEMEKNDCSHDWHHIQRVTRLALHLAKSVSGADHYVVELAAFLHDMNDHKYSARFDISLLLRELGVDNATISKVLFITENVSYSKQMEKIKKNEEEVLTDELKCVRDADRLDAIGATGIARCCAFTAVKGKRLYNENDWEGDGNTAVGHFFEKLFKLPDLMCTPLGRQLAEERIQIMREFIKQLEDEVNF